MKVLSAIDKIVQLRKRYKINQADLTRGKISRSHLGMIEIGKTKLSRRAAEVLVENFNEIFKERGIDKQITIGYLMESEKEQLKKIRKDFLSELESTEDLEKTIEQIEEIASDFDSETRIALYKKIGDKLTQNFSYKRAINYYLRILNDLIKDKKVDLLGEVSLDIVRIQLICEYYDEIVDFEKLIKRQIANFDTDTKQKIVFNIAIAYDGLKKYDQALIYYEMLEEIVTDPNKIFHLKNMKALCLEGLHRYDEAISLYRSTLLKYSDIEKKLIASSNLMYIAQIQDNRERCKFYLRKNRHLLEELESNSSIEEQYIERVYYSMAEAALYLNRSKEGIKYYYKVFRDMDNVSITNMKFKYLSISRLLEISDNRDIKNIEKLEKIYFVLLSEKADLMLGYRFVDYYNTYNFNEHLNNFLKRMLDYKEEEI